MTLQAPRLTWTRRRLPAVRPHRLGDPVMTALVALVVYALHGYDGALNLDLGVFIYGGLHVAQGTPPYIGVFNSVGPLADVVPGLAMWLGHLIGVDPILSARLFFTALSALCCSLVCVLARDTLGSRTAGFLAPAVFLTFEEFLQLASDGPREKTTMVVFLIACQILLGRRRWALAGACAALATLTWQPAFLVALGGVAAATLIGHQDRRRGILLRFTIGGLVPSVATVGYFVWVGALSEADYRRHVLPHSATVLNGLRDGGVPRIHFGVGTAVLLNAMGEAGADVVGVDWRTPLDQAAKVVGPDRAVQGNLDPATLFAPWKVVDRQARRVLREGGAAHGHVFNLGHGVLPETDPDVLTRLVDLVHGVTSDDPDGRDEP